MGAALPFMPMMVGAGAGALMNKKNPLQGAMLGAVGGAAAGPMMSGLTGVGGAASKAALEAGMTSETAKQAAQLATAQQAAGIMENPLTNAMLAEQTGIFGNAGVASTLQAQGANPMMAKLGAFATGGPQGAMGTMTGADKAKLGFRMANGIMNMDQQQQPQAMPPPPAMPQRPPMPSPTVPPYKKFITTGRRY